MREGGGRVRRGEGGMKPGRLKSALSAGGGTQGDANFLLEDDVKM